MLTTCSLLLSAFTTIIIDTGGKCLSLSLNYQQENGHFPPLPVTGMGRLGRITRREPAVTQAA